MEGILSKVLHEHGRSLRLDALNGVPSPNDGGSRRRMTAPSPRDTAIEERFCEWYLRWLEWALIPTDARLS